LVEGAESATYTTATGRPLLTISTGAWFGALSIVTGIRSDARTGSRSAAIVVANSISGRKVTLVSLFVGMVISDGMSLLMVSYRSRSRVSMRLSDA